MPCRERDIIPQKFTCSASLNLSHSPAPKSVGCNDVFITCLAPTSFAHRLGFEDRTEERTEQLDKLKAVKATLAVGRTRVRRHDEAL